MSKQKIIEFIVTVIFLATIVVFTVTKSKAAEKQHFANSQNENRLFYNSTDEELEKFDKIILTTFF